MRTKSNLPDRNLTPRHPVPHPPRPTPHPKSGTVLAFDFGEKRIGVAVGDLELRIAHPLTVIAAPDNRTRFAAIASLVSEWQPAMLVVGEPSHAEGSGHEIGRLARRFAERLKGRFRLPVHRVDERLTSHAAEARLREQRVRARRLKASLDMAAAQEILQTFFESLRERPSA